MKLSCYLCLLEHLLELAALHHRSRRVCSRGRRARGPVARARRCGGQPSQHFDLSDHGLVAASTWPKGSNQDGVPCIALRPQSGRNWFRLRGRQMGDHRQTMKNIHTRVTRAFLCVVDRETGQQNLFCRSRFALLRARLPRVNKVSYTSL